MNTDVDAKNLDTPMMRQYLEIKRQYPDDILFFRMGDFYEMFLEDAVYASRVLDIALTRRQDKVPMCGVPHHSMSQYVHPILMQGRRIAICDQLEDPAEAQGRIVRRGVTRILTPGSLFEEQLIEAKESRRLAAAVKNGDTWQLAIVELSTAQIVFERKTTDALGETATALGIREWVALDSEDFTPEFETLLQKRRYPAGDPAFQERVLKDVLQTKNLGIWELDDIESKALTLVLAYVREISPLLKLHWSAPVREYRKKTMVLDESTVRTLEILTSADGKLNPSLLGLLARSKSAAGQRLMAAWLARPSAELPEIKRRHDVVGILAQHNAYRDLIGAELGRIADLERVLTNLNNNPQVRHLGQVLTTLTAILKLQKIITDNRMQPLLDAGWNSLADFPAELHRLLDEAILTENLPPLLDARRFLKPGYMPMLDEFIELSQNAVGHLTRYEEEEKKKHGITTMRVKHNNVLGYFIEISKGQAAKAPEGYQRRQTLTNGERYTTAELKELENKILSAEEEVLRLQKGVFEDIRSQVLAAADTLKIWAERLSRLDVLLAFAECAGVCRLVRPKMHEGKRLSAEASRHPVIEAYFRSEMFIANDVTLDNGTSASPGPHLAIITGPNMAGKSTYIRQIGIMQIMAQAGSFVAAKSAELPVVDRVFTRIGAHDRLSRGESTFFVEMAECARIFRNYTKDSLILLDEVGRGTSTYDGISIAQAMIENLNDPARGRPKTLFATHYSELAHLISADSGIVGLTVSVIEKDGHVVFLRKIIEGVADKSYGIHVAQMAGMPRTVTERAHEIMLELEKKSDFLLADGIYHKSEVKPRKKIIPGVKDQGDLFGLSEPD
ncbi:MAG: DNA mismatch repair protein MutS [Turneriella sp.]|nr:DNA mismatch repair protein MutS [Turneriella sp.]